MKISVQDIIYILVKPTQFGQRYIQRFLISTNLNTQNVFWSNNTYSYQQLSIALSNEIKLYFLFLPGKD